MKRIIPVVIIAIALAIVALKFFGPAQSSMGEIVESWETANQTFRVRIDLRPERASFAQVLAGAYYVFQSAPVGSNNWHEIMTFHHGDPVPIPREQVHFVNDRVGYIFMGWMYAVTTDGGATWSVWNAQNDLSHWQCCNYRLIKDVHLESDGTGIMTLNPIPQRS